MQDGLPMRMYGRCFLALAHAFIRQAFFEQSNTYPDGSGIGKSGEHPPLSLPLEAEAAILGGLHNSLMS